MSGNSSRSPVTRRALYVVLALALLLVVGFAVSTRRDIPLETLKTRWAAAPSRFVELDGMQVHYRDEGSGPAVLLVHGTSSSLHTWDGWAAALRSKHRVLRVDLPAFGLTGPSPNNDYSYDAYVAFLEHFANRMGVDRFVLTGNSLGGYIAWRYALAHRERLRGLILVDSGGYLLDASGTPIAFRIARWPVVPRLLVRLDPKRLVEDGVKKSYGDPSRVTPEILERYYELSLRPGNRQAFVERMQIPRIDESARIREITVPTLVLWGEKDRLQPVEAARRFAHDIRGALAIVYPELGHIPMEEDAARTAADAERFMSELPAG